MHTKVRQFIYIREGIAYKGPLNTPISLPTTMQYHGMLVRAGPSDSGFDGPGVAVVVENGGTVVVENGGMIAVAMDAATAVVMAASVAWGAVAAANKDVYAGGVEILRSREGGFSMASVSPC